MTNNHVIKSADQALRSVAEFFDLSDTSKATRVSLRPDVLFITVHFTLEHSFNIRRITMGI